MLERGTAATLSYLRGRLPQNHRPRKLEQPSLPPHSGDATRGVAHDVSAASTPKGSGVEEDKDMMEAKERIAALQAEVKALSDEMEAPGMSQAKTYAVKKKLQMKRAALIREERALK